MDLAAAEIAGVQERYPQATIVQDGDLRALLVPGVRLPPGWNLAQTVLAVIVPVGFPHVGPDCFFADAELRLASGAEPANSAMQPLQGRQYRWFSWHPASWAPGSGALGRYLRFCEARLREVR
ncbi:MAG TPA: E2/UBC family protein [Solirubrobacterales bacterium]